MNEPKITINVMPGAQMNGYVKEQHNYFGTVQQITSSEAKKDNIEEVEVNNGKDASLSDREQKLPDVLASEEAMRYWERLRQKGFVDEHCQLKPETTRKQAMYIAELFAERLNIKSKWKTFEQLWGISNLAQEKWNMLETGTTPSRSNEIDLIFKD